MSMCGKQKESNSLLIFSGVSFALSVLLTWLVIMGDTQLLDATIRLKVDQWSDTELAAYANYLTPSVIESMVALGSTTILVLFSASVLAALIWRKKIKFALLYGILLGGGALVTVLLKMSIQRARPGAVYYFNLFGLTGDVVSYSYPSGHVVKNTLFFAFLICLIHAVIKNRLLKISLITLCVIVPLVIGIGQVISDRHYLSDVVGGYLVSCVWLGASLLLLRLTEPTALSQNYNMKSKK